MQDSAAEEGVSPVRETEFGAGSRGSVFRTLAVGVVSGKRALPVALAVWGRVHGVGVLWCGDLARW